MYIQVLWMCGAHQAAPEGVSRVVDMIGEIEPCNLQLKAQAPLRRLYIISPFLLSYILFYVLSYVLSYVLFNVISYLLFYVYFYVLSCILSNILAKSNPNMMLFHFYDILSYHIITTHYMASIYLKLANITSH